jgi:hypothetical protein
MASAEPTADDFGQAVLDLAGSLTLENHERNDAGHGDDAGQGETTPGTDVDNDKGQGPTGSTGGNGNGTGPSR